MKTRCLPLSSLFLTFLTFFVASVATAQVPSYVSTNGLVGYWPFNGNANDESGNGNNGTVNGAALTADRFGDVDEAYVFNGISNVININSSNSLNSLTAITISAWIYKQTNSALPEGIFGPATYLPNSPGYFFRIVENKVNLAISQPYTSPSSNQTVDVGQWVFVTGTYDNNSIKLFVNGVLDGENIVGADFLDSWTSSNPLTIGQEIDYGSPNSLHAWNGKLDDIGIWNRALTAGEVLALYNGCSVTPIAIAGSNTPSAFATSTYTCDNNAGSTYNWTVSNGVIASGQGTNSVNILWGAEGVGSVSVVETTADGCVGDAVIYDVNVQCVVSGIAIEGPVGPEAFSNSTYTCNGATNSTYQWTITNGVIVSGQGTSSVTVLWASTGIGNISVIETTAEGCLGTTLSQDVVVIPTNVEELSNALILYPNPATTELNLQTTSDLIGTDLFVFDALGKQIHKQQILSTNTIINTSSFAVGNYVVKVGGGVKKFEVRK